MNYIIVDYDHKYYEDFVNLSIEWLEKYVSVEPEDEKIINDPYGMILNDGGHIFFALSEGRPVGTVSLIKLDDSVCELAKLAVTEDYKGFKIGRQLMEKCIETAKAENYEKIILYTNKNLLPALSLYKKFNFEEVDLSFNKYIESDLKMELLL